MEAITNSYRDSYGKATTFNKRLAEVEAEPAVLQPLAKVVIV